MVKYYVARIKEGALELYQVPTRWREAVSLELNSL